MGRGALAKGSWCEIAPPQIISVERCSPRQKTMETILERMAALGAMVETAPPRIILVERSLSKKRGSLDTIAEESISMAMDLVNGAAAASTEWTDVQLVMPSSLRPSIALLFPDAALISGRKPSLHVESDVDKMLGPSVPILLNWPDFHVHVPFQAWTMRLRRQLAEIRGDKVGKQRTSTCTSASNNSLVHLNPI